MSNIHNKEILIYVFREKELRGLNPKFCERMLPRSSFPGNICRIFGIVSLQCSMVYNTIFVILYTHDKNLRQLKREKNFRACPCISLRYSVDGAFVGWRLCETTVEEGLENAPNADGMTK